MDPASAIIGIVSFGFTVFAKVNDIRKLIKGAPQQVQALQESYVVTRVLLCKLQTLNTHTITYTAEELACFELLCERSQQCLRDVDEAVKKVVAQTSDANADRTPKVRLLKWFLNKGDFEEMTKKLKDVREALGTMVDLMQLNHLQVIAVHIINDVPLRNSSVPNHAPAAIDLNPSRRTGPLQCSDNCTCRCHALSLYPIVSQSAVPYLGQFFISPRILDWMKFDPLGRCNIDTCRGTCLTPSKVTYILPRVPFHGSLQATPFERIHLSINAYRTVSYTSPILKAIWSADVHGVRDLFAKQQASIWDVDIDGSSILWHACDQWQRYPTEDRLKTVRFLVEAGADALLFAETKTAHSAHDTLAIGLFAHLLHEPDSGRSFTATIQTSSAAINIFRSIFNTDALDALQDVLSRRYRHSDEDVSLLLTSLETTEYTVARSSVFDAIEYTPLMYATRFSPSSVESLLAEGADATADPTVAFAVCCGAQAYSLRSIELFIDNGADVNMKDRLGRTALHWACYQCYYHDFFELVRCAEDDIDWDARTPEGQNALDLFDIGVSERWASDLTSEEVDEFRSTLVSHMDSSRFCAVEDEPLDIPGAFPITM